MEEVDVVPARPPSWHLLPLWAQEAGAAPLRASPVRRRRSQHSLSATGRFPFAWMSRSGALQALRAGLALALGAGLGAVAEGWRRRRADARPAPGLLGRLPVLPVAAAAEVPAVPAVPGALASGGPGELAKYGLPGLAQLKSRESYVLCYDPRTRGALWVVEQLRPERLRGDGDRRSCDFREDESVHVYHRATNADYRGSGFDRGHLAAAANHRWSQKAMDDTFYLSNVAPQVELPVRLWKERPAPRLWNLGLRLCRMGRLPSARTGQALTDHAARCRKLEEWSSGSVPAVHSHSEGP